MVADYADSLWTGGGGGEDIGVGFDSDKCSLVPQDYNYVENSLICKI